MSSDVRVYDAESIESLAWPDTTHAAQARDYLLRMVKDGPQTYIDNARVRMLALAVGDEVMPLVLADGEPECTNVCSPEAHYVDYAREELAKPGTPAAGRRLRGLLPLLGWTLRTFRAGRVCYVNNWLWTTNPIPSLTTNETRAMTDRLVQEFPDRALVFRSLNEAFCAPLMRALSDAGWRAVASRRIYLSDGRYGACLKKDDTRRDLRLARRGGFERVETGFADADYERMIGFYRELYVGKYPRMNPQFNAKHLRAVNASGLLTLHAFRRDGTIESFWGDFERDGVMTPALIGYNMAQPRELGLYRMTVIDIIAEAARRKRWANLSAGAGEFKRRRGCVPVVEFDMVYTAHLGPARRFPWWVLRRNYTAERMAAMGD